MNLILLGAPGAGKGTQAEIICAKLNIPSISTGNILRAAVKEGTEMGLKAKSFMDAGALVPDEVIIGILKERLAQADCANGFILDGFPRTTVQAEEFDKILGGHGLGVTLMVDMHVPEEELVRRILLRGKDSGRADDASEEVIRGRLDVYREQTAVVADYYAAQGKYASVNGTGTMEEVFSRIAAVIEGLK
mgnify:CR=1 FL=1